MTDLIDDPDEFVTVKDFIEQVDAQMAKGLLESAGIECFLLGENTNSLLGAAFFAQLQVHQKDEAAALEILGSSDDELKANERVDDED
jgi:Putative prokaryotic signal transducing protein